MAHSPALFQIAERGILSTLVLIAAALQGQEFRRDFDFSVRKAVKFGPPMRVAQHGLWGCRGAGIVDGDIRRRHQAATPPRLGQQRHPAAGT